MEALFRRHEYGYEQLTELSLDGLLTRLTENTWVRKGAILEREDRMEALRSDIPPRLVLSHSSAHWVHSGLGRAPSQLSFITYPRRRVLHIEGIEVHEVSITATDWTTICGLPITIEERTLYDLLLPHVRSQQAGSSQYVKNLITEVPRSARHRFRLYLEEITRRPYVRQMRELFDQFCASDRFGGY